MRILHFLYVFIGLMASVLASQPAFEKHWKNTKYQKSLDVSKSFVKERHDIEIVNIGSEPQSEYFFAMPRATAKDVSLLVALANTNGKRTLLKSKMLPFDHKDFVYYTISLPYPISPKSDFQFIVSTILINQMSPYPEHIPMVANQVLRVDSFAYPSTPYETEIYTLGLLGAKEHQNLEIEDLPYALELTSKNDNYVLRASETIPPNCINKYSFTYVRTEPLTYVNYLRRDLWVSHWSDALQLEEYYEITNHGAKLDKGFSRGKYFSEKLALKPHWSISALRIPFDPTKEIQENSVYYVDKVGNVSTSQVYKEELIIRPRFPLFGGWNYNFTIGWNYDLKQFLKQKDDEFILNAHILDGISDTTYEKVNFNIYLPEGAELVDYAMPFTVDAPEISYELSYLDVEDGHLKVSFEIENIVDEMKNLEIVLRYRYSKFNMLSKPLHAALYLFLAFMALYVLKMIDLSIKPKEKKGGQNTNGVETVSQEEELEIIS